MTQLSQILPSSKLPKVAKATAAQAGDLNAVLAIVPEAPGKTLFDSLPESERWQELNARSKPRAGSVRSTVLANRRQTIAVIGYIGSSASAFERLSLAGRMIKELAVHSAGSSAPRSIGLTALGKDVDATASIDALLAATLANAFQLPSFKSSASDDDAPGLERLVLLDSPEVDISYALAAASGNNLVRWLTALPPNLLNSSSYHQAIAKLARSHKIAFEWLDEAALRKQGANAFLAVSAANSRRDAGIAHLSYRPAGQKSRAPDIALVGKGILFDTGGVNLKPHKSMLDMHTDMSGSAVALSTLLALAELKVPYAVDAWLAVTENQIGPTAYRPQEVIRASNGVTIQIIHTDAEGRMVLADTLALASRTQPRFMMDFATLTGAAVYSLTERMSAVLTNQERLAPTLFEAGRASGERVWNFPLDADFDTDLESKVADILQCSVDGKGDHILATRFLKRFVPDEIPWAHVDLASATRSGGLGHIGTEITGFGVRFALELILKQKILDMIGPRKEGRRQ